MQPRSNEVTPRFVNRLSRNSLPLV